MAKAKGGHRTLDSYTVKHINKTIQPGDCVLMRPAESSKPSYVARVEKIEADGRGANVRVHVRWYYRPEDSVGLRRKFHGSKEVFLSDHLDVQSADTIEGMCTVHSFKSYTKLAAVGNEDYFCRFEYNSSSGAFNPDRVAVYKGTVNVRCLIILMVLWFSVKVRARLCSELQNLVVRVSKIIPEIEAAHPGASGMQALCSINSGIATAKYLLQHCSESSILYLVLTGDKIRSRCKKSRNLMEHSLSQIQNMVPLMLAAKICKLNLEKLCGYAGNSL